MELLSEIDHAQFKSGTPQVCVLHTYFTSDRVCITLIMNNLRTTMCRAQQLHRKKRRPDWAKKIDKTK